MLTPFPTEFPAEALQVVWDAYRNRSVDVLHASLCGWNVVGYLAGKAIGPAPMMSAGEDQVNLAFEAALTQGGEPGVMTSPEAVPWALILQVAWQIAQRFIFKQ